MTLEEACVLVADCPHTTAPDEGEGYPLVRTPNIGYGRLVFDKMHRVSKGVYETRNKRARPEPGDLIFAREAPAGNVALVMPGQEVCLGQRTVLLRPNKGIVDSAFLTYYLLSPEQRNRLIGTATGVTVAHINIPEIRRLKVSFPPLPVQKKIASILSAYDDLIENNRRRIAILEEMARKVYRKRFSGKNANGTIADVGAVCDTIGGGTPSTSISDYWEGGTIPWVVPTDVTRNTSLILLDTDRKITQKGLESSSSRMLPARSILMTSRASVGYFAIANFPVCTNQGFISIVPHEEKMRYYLLHNLMERVEEIRSNAKGSTFPEISKMRFRSLKINVPSQGALNNFHLIVEPIYNQVQTLAEANRKLAAARDALLPKLMSGRICSD